MTPKVGDYVKIKPTSKEWYSDKSDLDLEQTYQIASIDENNLAELRGTLEFFHIDDLERVW